MYATEHRTSPALISPLALAIWWAAATALTAYSLRGFPPEFSGPVTLVCALSGAALAALIIRHPLPDNSTRVAAYICAFLANQVSPVFFAISALAPEIPYTSQGFGAQLVVETLGCAGLAVWTFVLIRVWVSVGAQLPRGPFPASRTSRACLGCAVAVVSIAGLVGANYGHAALAAFVDVPLEGYPLDGVGDTYWPIIVMFMALAGVVEEPVFVGVAVLLWPRLRLRSFFGVWALTSLARASIHLYYAAWAGDETPTAVALIVLWCAMWSGVNLLLVYVTRRLWPVMLAHGLQNTAVVGAHLAGMNPFLTDTEWTVLVWLTAAVLTVLAFLAVGTLGFLALATVRLFTRRSGERQELTVDPDTPVAAGTPVPPDHRMALP